MLSLGRALRTSWIWSLPCKRLFARFSPAGTAESDVEVTIPFETDRLRIELACRFHAIADWDVAAIQYCNFFPEEHRYPGEWGSDRVLVMAADGQRMLIDHQGSGDRRLLDGETLHGHQGNLFVALYGGPRASILALSRPRAIDGGTADYALCGCWLDNHLNVTAQSDTIPAGTRWHVDLTLVLTQTTNIDDDLRALGARALETGTLP